LSRKPPALDSWNQVLAAVLDLPWAIPRVQHMLRVVILTVLLCLLLSPCSHAAVEVEERDKDLGRIYRDEPQKIVFRLRNQSEDALRILDIEPSCDCTTAQVVPDPVPPGAEAEVLTFFDPMGYEGRGPIQESVRLTTSDARDPEIRLTFRTEVTIGPEPEPRALKFGRICRGESDTLQVLISSGQEEDLKILKAYSDTACVMVEWAGDGDKADGDYMVIVKNTEMCGRVAAFVTFETSDSLRPTIRVPVTVSLVGRIVADPDMVAFGPTLPGAYVSQSVRIYCREKLPFDIVRVLSTVADLEPELERLSDDSFDLRLKIKGGADAGRVSGEVRLETDCPDEPSVVIQVTGYIRSGK
jgi:hypothetical protein